MPRSLPWKQSGSTASTTTTTNAKSSRQSTLNIHLEKADVATTAAEKYIENEEKPKMTINSEEYMIDGLQNDDKFIMLEDEFLSMAKSITAHLHHAHYRDMEEKEKMAGETKKDKPRYVLPGVQMPTQAQQEKDLALRRKQLQSGKAEEDDEDGIFSGGALRKLMQNSGKPTIMPGLSQSASQTQSRANTRASAGFSKPAKKGSPSKVVALSSVSTSNAYKSNQNPGAISDTDESDLDDLDVMRPRTNRSELPSKIGHNQRTISYTNNAVNTILPSKDEQNALLPKSILKSTKQAVFSDDDMNDFLTPEEAERWKRRQEMQKKKSHDNQDKTGTTSKTNAFGLSFK